MCFPEVFGNFSNQLFCRTPANSCFVILPTVVKVEREVKASIMEIKYILGINCLGFNLKFKLQLAASCAN